MKKKNMMAVLGTIMAVSALIGVGYANGNIKIVVNGKQITSDVAPRMVNNRVMVPISFVSSALGAHVAWDQKTQTVTINGKTANGAPDLWSETLAIPGRDWVRINQTVSQYIRGYDERDDAAVKSVVVDDFSKNFYGGDGTQYSPIGGIYPSVLDWNYVDAKSAKDGYWVRVHIFWYSDVEPVESVWDLEIDKEFKIKTFKLIKERNQMSSYTLFPGLTYSKSTFFSK